jgi:hypothetical protein
LFGKDEIMKNNIILFILLITFMFPPAFSEGIEKNPVLREEVTLKVDGVVEVWRLEWMGTPVPACEPEGDAWYTCPCMGFAFGEAGDLDLVRKRAGQKDERFSLTRLFRYGEAPGPSYDRVWTVLPRWKNHTDDDKIGSSALPSEVKARPIIKIIKFGDYDHDGRATEFLLQIGNLPCAKSMTLAVGISQKNPHLHAFTSFKSPDKPLILQKEQWEALRNSTDRISVVNWPCGDHGLDGEEEYMLQSKSGTIYSTRRTYLCTQDDKRGQLQEEEEF